MARRHDLTNVGETVDQQPTRPSGKDAAFRTHLMVYLVVGCFLLTLNLLTSPGELWFYWPMFFWGWAVVIQAAATYGTDAPVRVVEALRSIIPGVAPSTAPSSAQRIAPPAPVDALGIASLERRIQRLWRTARQIPDAAVREQAFRICAAADRIVEVMATDRTDPRTVAWFEQRLLAPTESLLSGYLRLANRDVAGADSTLRRVEEENLPRIEARLDTLYQQLHRGDVIDLAVASEMLDIELADVPPSLRSHS